MKHNRVNIKDALEGCRICAAALLDKQSELRDIVEGRLKEVINETL